MKWRIVEYLNHKGKPYYELEKKTLFGWDDGYGDPFGYGYGIYNSVKAAEEAIKKYMNPHVKIIKEIEVKK